MLRFNHLKPNKKTSPSLNSEVIAQANNKLAEQIDSDLNIAAIPYFDKEKQYSDVPSGIILLSSKDIKKINQLTSSLNNLESQQLKLTVCFLELDKNGLYNDNYYSKNIDLNYLLEPASSDSPLSRNFDAAVYKYQTKAAVESHHKMQNKKVYDPSKEVAIQFPFSKDFETKFNNNLQAKFTRILVSDPKLSPVASVKIQDIESEKEFAFSPVYHDKKHHRDYAVMYAVNDKGNTSECLPRLLYKSQSSGIWRVTPAILFDGTYAKHGFGPGPKHYTQATDLDHDIVHYLDSVKEQEIENSHDITKYFSSYEERFDVYTIEQEHICSSEDHSMKAFWKLDPGHGFREIDGLSPSEYFEKLDYPEGFIPDFSVGSSREASHFYHTLLGKVQLEFYPAKINDRPIEWAMASDENGRVWIQSIKLLDTPLNTYGVPREILDSGLLTNKPVEYGSQVNGLIENKDYQVLTTGRHSYRDITLLLNNLRPIQEYREAEGLTHHTKALRPAGTQWFIAQTKVAKEIDKNLP